MSRKVQEADEAAVGQADERCYARLVASRQPRQQ